jgi:kynureninase
MTPQAQQDREGRPADEQRARELDDRDPLPTLRGQFRVPPFGPGEAAYLAGNSLGLQPRSVRAQLEQELDDWARLGVAGHLEATRP